MCPTDYSIARDKIRERIISLQLPPGSVISEAQLMEELGLGRTPIREALKLLEAENLVVIVPRRGIFVSEIGLNHLHQIYEMRMALEPLSARLAAMRITPSRLSQLQLCSAEMGHTDNLDIPTVFRVDRAFHRLLATASGNELLVRDVTRHYNLALRLWNLVQSRLTPADLAVDTHVRLIEAVANHDADEAEAVMREHIDRFNRRIRELL
ncbi:MAG: GntR family transcriptional regulator [Anaerolineae bacterium]|jgi:DNA-binding GntR family transcriptional regulator|nr:GntR family transcriptional regulator [Anaerolineae bacterium]